MYLMYVEWQKTAKIHSIKYIIPRTRNTSVRDSSEYLLSSLGHLLFHSWAEDVTMPQEERRSTAFIVWHKLHLYNMLFTFEIGQYSNHDYDHGIRRTLFVADIAGRRPYGNSQEINTCKHVNLDIVDSRPWLGLMSGDEGMVLTEKRRRRCCSGEVIY